MRRFTTDETLLGRQASRWSMLAILLLGQTMASLVTSIVSVAGPAIRHDLHLPGAALQLVLSGYVLAYAVLLVTGARLGGDHGPRRLFVLGVGGFTAFSLASGLAPNVGVLVAAQVALGASAALMAPQVLSLIHVTFEGAELERAVGLYSIVLAAGVGLGQVLGGLLVTADVAGLGWRPIFLVSVPAGLLLLLAAPAKLPLAPGREDANLDLPGVLTLGVAMALVVAPLTVGAELDWPRWAWLCLAGGALAAGCFVAVELGALRGDRQPLLDLRALLAPGVAPTLLVVLATMAGYGGFLFAVSQHLQVGLRFTPLAAGMTFAAYAAGFAAVSARWPSLGQQVQRWLPGAGLLALAAADMVLAARLVASGWSPALVVLLALAGGGHAAAFGPLVARIAQRLGADRAPAFSALVTTTVQIAIVIGVAGLGSLYRGVARAGGPGASGHALALVCAAVSGIALLGAGLALRVAARS
jgi:MFS family permease